MVEYDKVVRIELDSELFYDEISDVVTEWWVDYEGLEVLPQTLNYLQMSYKEEIKALKNKEIDYIALSSDL